MPPLGKWPCTDWEIELSKPKGASNSQCSSLDLWLLLQFLPWLPSAKQCSLRAVRWDRPSLPNLPFIKVFYRSKRNPKTPSSGCWQDSFLEVLGPRLFPWWISAELSLDVPASSIQFLFPFVESSAILGWSHLLTHSIIFLFYSQSQMLMLGSLTKATISLSLTLMTSAVFCWWALCSQALGFQWGWGCHYLLSTF